MEITLEKIELVKDRTGVSYKEAKEALEAANGSVVDAIINIEEAIDEKGKSRFTGYAGVLVENLKAIVKKGNVSRITVKKDDEVIMNLPVNVGIIGTVMAPIAAAVGVAVAFGTKCSIEVVKEDGTIIDVNEMANDAKEGIVEKSSGIADEMKIKSAEFYEAVKEKSVDAYEAMKEKAVDAIKRDDRCSCCDCGGDTCDCGCDDLHDCDCEDCEADADNKLDIDIEIELDNACASCEAEDCENCK